MKFHVDKTSNLRKKNAGETRLTKLQVDEITMARW
jgi:hypothetical protein